jgi:hypothetical protein
MDIQDKQSMYNAIQAANGDSKDLWAIVQDIHKQHKDRIKTKINELNILIQKEKEKGSNFKQLLDDKEELRARVLEDLFIGSQSGNSQASDRLAKLAGLDVASSDITIEVTDYSATLIDCPHCGNNVHREKA